MIIYIIFGLFIAGLCLEQKQVASSIDEDDVLLRHNYRSENTYLTELPQYEQKPGNFDQNSKTLKNIQYAPLNSNEESYASREVKNTYSSRKKENLEPRVVKTTQSYDYTTQSNLLHFVEGHNIIVPHKSNTLETHVNMRKQDSLSETNKGNNQKNVQSIPNHYQENFESEKITEKLKTCIETKEVKNFNNLKSVPTKKSFQELSALEKIHMEPVFNPFVKVPRLHLNIARAYNFAKLPLKAPVLIHPNELKRPKPAYVSNIDVLLKEKTFLYS